jgi:hypothetical protein
MVLTITVKRQHLDGRLNNMRTFTRATSDCLAPNVYIVDYKGASFIVQRQGEKTWKIRRRGMTGVIKMITEQHGYGKEEAIHWIERSY